MPNDHPLYYLPPTRSASVEDIASHYVKEIKRAYPSGPYTIGGFCGAGMVALEIAQQLNAAGEHVSALILFEYYSPDSTLSKKSLKYHTRLLSHYKRRIISHKKAAVKGLDLVKFIVKKSYKKVKNFLKPPPPKFFTSPEFRKYRHKPYSGKVVLFQASIAPLEATDSRLMGWGNYFKGEVEVITIKGGHLGIFREPEIRKLAQELSVVLDEVNSDQENIQKSTS